jgi:hypothetical protein
MLAWSALGWDVAPAQEAKGPAPAPATTPAPASSTLTAPAMIAVPEPADFKLSIAFYGLGKEPITTAELLFRGGLAYYFASEERGEILILDRAAARLDLLDLERKIQAALPFSQLDQKQAILHRAVEISIRDHEEAGTRADRVAAGMSRALIEPALKETYDPAARHLRLTNSAVTVDATGEPEPDPARRELIEAALRRLTQLAAARDPRAIPPFIRLDAIHALTAGHQLRPVELSFVYRLTGPPRRHRWTYRLTSPLSDRDVVGIKGLAKAREHLGYVSFEDYERHSAGPEGKTKAAK